MASTSPDNIFSPDKGQAFTLTDDLQQTAESVQTALNKRANLYVGTSSEREAASTLPNGSHWKDTDGIGMLWKRGLSNWVPAIWRWAGTTTQMNSFTQASDGFEWYNTSDGSEYLRVGGSWSRRDSGWVVLDSYLTSSFRGRLWGRRSYGTAQLVAILKASSQFTNGTYTTVGVLPAEWMPAVEVNSRGETFFSGAHAGQSYLVPGTGEIGIFQRTGGTRSDAQFSLTYLL